MTDEMDTEFDHTLPLVEPAENEEPMITVLSEEPGSASFQITDEDHTLGNALRYVIMKKWVGLFKFACNWLTWWRATLIVRKSSSVVTRYPIPQKTF